MIKYIIAVLFFLNSFNTFAIDTSHCDPKKLDDNCKDVRKDNILPYIKDYNIRNDTDYDLPEILDQKIHKNSFRYKTIMNNMPVKVFMNPHEKVMNTFSSSSNLYNNKAFEEQNDKMNKYQSLDYGPVNNRNYVYGFGFSIPIDNNKD